VGKRTMLRGVGIGLEKAGQELKGQGLKSL
jgi:hypothetical protein